MESKLNLPMKKMFVKDLIECSSQIELSKRVQMVWLQGSICELDSSMMKIDDGSAVIEIIFSNNLGGTDWMAKGKYCMIIGEVIFQNSQLRVKALKITDLSNKPLHREIWPLEITHQKKYRESSS